MHVYSQSKKKKEVDDIIVAKLLFLFHFIEIKIIL